MPGYLGLPQTGVLAPVLDDLLYRAQKEQEEALNETLGSLVRIFLQQSPIRGDFWARQVTLLGWYDPARQVTRITAVHRGTGQSWDVEFPDREMVEMPTYEVLPAVARRVADKLMEGD